MKHFLIAALSLLAVCSLTRAQTILGKHPADKVMPAFWAQNGNADTVLDGLNTNATHSLNGGKIGDGTINFSKFDPSTFAMLGNGGPGGGTGNLTGPGSSAIGNLLIFANTAGTLASDSGIPLVSLALNAYVAEVSNLWLSGSNNLNTAIVARPTFALTLSNVYAGSNVNVTVTNLANGQRTIRVDGMSDTQFKNMYSENVSIDNVIFSNMEIDTNSASVNVALAAVGRILWNYLIPSALHTNLLFQTSNGEIVGMDLTTFIASLPSSGGSGNMVAANNLSDLANKTIALNNLGGISTNYAPIWTNGGWYISNPGGWVFQGSNGFYARSNTIKGIAVTIDTNGVTTWKTNGSVVGTLDIQFGNITLGNNTGGRGMLTANVGSFTVITTNAASGSATLSLNANTSVAGLFEVQQLLTLDSGIFGDGSGLTGLTAANLTGTVPLGTLPSNVVLTNDARNITFGGTSTNLGGVILPSALAANTNAAITAANAVQLISSNTVALDPLAPATGVNIAGVGSATNLTPIHLGSGLSYDPSNSNLNVTGSSPMITSNILVQTTNEIVWDIKKVQHLTLEFNTNLALLTISNAWAVTNSPSGLVQLDTWEDTNGTWRVLATNIVGGLLRTYGGWIRGTNASQYDTLGLKLDGTLTNLLGHWDTNAQPVTAFTNTLTAGGGGGGGGAFTYTIVNHATASSSANLDALTTSANFTGANVIVAQVTWTTGGMTVSDSAGNTYTADTAQAPSSNDQVKQFYCISPTVTSSMTFTAHPAGDGVGYPTLHVLGANKSSGTPIKDTDVGATFLSASATFTQPTLTPAGDDELIVSSMCLGQPYGQTLTSVAGFTIVDAVTADGLAYQIQTTGTAVNPLWTWGASANDAGGVQISFK